MVAHSIANAASAYIWTSQKKQKEEKD